jgi:ParB family chromosome partitioning protein
MTVTIRSAMIHKADLLPQRERNIRRHVGDVDELADSIRAHGIVEPLVVAPTGQQPVRYRIIDGHRRFKAAGQVGLTHLPCVIRDGQPPSTDRVLMIVANVQRKDLNPVDLAEALLELRSHHTLDEVARMTGLSPTTIASRIALKDLPTPVQQQVRDRTMPLRQAEALARQVRQTASGGAYTGKKAGGNYFGPTHRLFQVVIARCTHREGQRVLYGRAGCGACWEATIREDELAHVGIEDSTTTPAGERSA